MKLIKLAQSASVVLATFALSLGALELAGRIYSKVLPGNLGVWEFRASQPLPYVGAPYFGKAFIDESFSQPGGWDLIPGTRVLIPKEFKGTYFNVRNGCRVTVGQPTSYKHHVLIFGGSTVYNSEVPDEFTLPSALQKLLNEKFPNTYRVENYGVTSVSANQELERLKRIRINPGDIVIFYDGVNDVLNGVYYQRPDGFILGETQSRLRSTSKVLQKFIRFYEKASNYSAFIRVFLNPYNYDEPDHIRNEKRLRPLIEQTADHYRMILNETHHYVVGSRGTFIHFLQPQLFSHGYQTEYEKDFLLEACYPGIKRSFQETYPTFQRVAENLLDKDRIPSFDLSLIFVKRPQGQEYYLDYCHVTHIANQRIAEAMLEKASSFFSAAISKDSD